MTLTENGDYELLVTIPNDAPTGDIRRAIMAMSVGRTRAMRVENANRVARSKSAYVEDRHRELAHLIIEGPGDIIWQKLGIRPGVTDMCACDNPIELLSRMIVSGQRLSKDRWEWAHADGSPFCQQALADSPVATPTSPEYQ